MLVGSRSATLVKHMSDPRPRIRQIRKRIGRNILASPPRISVVITAYNNSEHIRDTIESVLNQKFREHEIIVVNDGSDDTDALERELKFRFEDITYIRQRHAGPGAARNTGIENARGDLVAFLQAGDMWHNDFLASQYIFLERHAYDLVYCDAAIFGTHSPYRRNFFDTHPSRGPVSFQSLIERRCNVLISGTLARKSMIAKAGMFEHGGIAKPGLHLWLRMISCGSRFGYQQKQLVRRRVYRDEPQVDHLVRVEEEKELFERILATIEMSNADTRFVQRRVADLESRLAVEQGNSFLKSGDYTEALTAFRVADRHRPSIRIKAITWLTRLAPKAALRFVDNA